MQYTWHKFKVTGLDTDTGRKSTVTIITRQDKPSEKDLIKQEILPPYKFVEMDFDEPTDAQKNYALNLGIKLIDGMNRQDVSSLISRNEDNDVPASDELKNFAYIKDVYFSPFVGENALWDLLSNLLEGDDLRQFKKQFPEPADDDFDTGIEMPNVTNEDLYIDAGIYDESYSIDGQDGKIRLNFFAVIIKRGGKTPDVILLLSKIKDVHIGVSDSIFDLNYIRFVLEGDDTTYYQPSSFPAKGFEYAVRFSNKKYIPIAERIKQRVAELSSNKMTGTGFYTPNQKPSSNHYFSIGCTGAVILLVLCFLINSCFGVNDVSETNAPPPTPKVEESPKNVTTSSQPQYDILQQFFLALNPNVVMQQVEDIIVQNKIPHTSWSGSDRRITYKIAYKQGVALQYHAESGDYLEITFDANTKKIREWCYYNWEHSAEVYFFTEPFQNDGKKYVGYVYHDYDKPTYSNYYQCSNSHDAMARLFNHKSNI